MHHIHKSYKYVQIFANPNVNVIDVKFDDGAE